LGRVVVDPLPSLFYVISAVHPMGCGFPSLPQHGLTSLSNALCHLPLARNVAGARGADHFSFPARGAATKLTVSPGDSLIRFYGIYFLFNLLIGIGGTAHRAMLEDVFEGICCEVPLP
jgi:hypothetical protein